MLTLELPQLDLRYAGLRIADPSGVIENSNHPMTTPGV